MNVNWLHTMRLDIDLRAVRVGLDAEIEKAEIDGLGGRADRGSQRSQYFNSRWLNRNESACRRKIDVGQHLGGLRPPLGGAIFGRTAGQVIVGILARGGFLCRVRLGGRLGPMAIATTSFFDRRFAILILRRSFVPRKQFTHAHSLREKHGKGKRESDEAPYHVNKIGNKGD